jgi:hypothetical protein
MITRAGVARGLLESTSLMQLRARQVDAQSAAVTGRHQLSARAERRRSNHAPDELFT